MQDYWKSEDEIGREWRGGEGRGGEGRGVLFRTRSKGSSRKGSLWPTYVSTSFLPCPAPPPYLYELTNEINMFQVLVTGISNGRYVYGPNDSNMHDQMILY